MQLAGPAWAAAQARLVRERLRGARLLGTPTDVDRGNAGAVNGESACWRQLNDQVLWALVTRVFVAGICCAKNVQVFVFVLLNTVLSLSLSVIYCNSQNVYFN